MRTYRNQLLLAFIVSLALIGPGLYAHCQIPCGIYGDETRFVILREHVTTVEKSMAKIQELGKAESPDWNQLVRWVENKEQHADELSEIVTYYFMTQRIKPPADGADAKTQAKYQKEIGLLHRMLVHAMKAKQTTDTKHVKELKSLIDAFEESYFADHKH